MGDSTIRTRGEIELLNGLDSAVSNKRFNSLYKIDFDKHLKCKGDFRFISFDRRVRRQKCLFSFKVERNFDPHDDNITISS